MKKIIICPLVLLIGFVATPVLGMSYDPAKNSPHYYSVTNHDTLTVHEFGQKNVKIERTLSRSDLFRYRPSDSGFHFTAQNLQFTQKFRQNKTGPYEQLGRLVKRAQSTDTAANFAGEASVRAENISDRFQLEAPFLDREEDKNNRGDTRAQSDTELMEAKSMGAVHLLQLTGGLPEESLSPLFERSIDTGMSFRFSRSTLIAGIRVTVQAQMSVKEKSGDTVVIAGEGKQNTNVMKSALFSPFQDRLVKHLPATKEEILFNNPENQSTIVFEGRFVVGRDDGMVNRGSWNILIDGGVTLQGRDDGRSEILRLRAQQSGSIKRREAIETKYLPELGE